MDRRAKIHTVDDVDVRLPHGWTVEPTPVADPVAADLLRRYFFDVASSYHGRTATDGEVAAAMGQDPSADLAPPTGLFLVARYHGVPSGCVGLRFAPPGFAELKRLFVVPDVRGTSGGVALLLAAQRHADVDTLRLETRADLTAARRLYEANGFHAVPAFTDNRYAGAWYAKQLRPGAAASDRLAHDG